MMDSLNALDEIEMMLGIYREKVLFMWGYLPGLTPNKLPLLAPFMWRTPPTLTGDRWMDVCGGGCGFAMAISGTYLSLFNSLCSVVVCFKILSFLCSNLSDFLS